MLHLYPSLGATRDTLRRRREALVSSLSVWAPPHAIPPIRLGRIDPLIVSSPISYICNPEPWVGEKITMLPILRTDKTGKWG
jgi:hypothetical protein